MTVSPSRKVVPSTVASASPGTSFDRCGSSPFTRPPPGLGVAERHAAVQREDLGRRGRGGALDHGAHRGVVALDQRALVVGEREHVQQQRLLDLGAVEEIAAALGRDLRVLGQHDRGARAARRRRPSRAPGTCSRCARPRRRAGRRTSRRQAAAAAASRAGSRPAPRRDRPRRGEVRRVGHVQLDDVARPRRGPSAERRITARRPPSANTSAQGAAASAAERARGERHAALGGLVARPAGLQEAQLGRDRGAGVRARRAAQRERVAGAPVGGGVGRRIDDAERRGRGVLGRPAGVGVERVALPQQRAHERLEMLRVRHASGTSSGSRSSMRSTHASKECSPCSRR